MEIINGVCSVHPKLFAKKKCSKSLFSAECRPIPEVGLDITK